VHTLLILIVILEKKRETYTGVMAIDWQDTYVSILSLVVGINYIYIHLSNNCNVNNIIINDVVV